MLLKTIVAGMLLAQQAAPDLILTNGKVNGDNVGPHSDLLLEFPYVGPPHQDRVTKLPHKTTPTQNQT